MDNLRTEVSNFEQGAGADFAKLVEGRNIFRFLPPWSSEGKFFQRVGFHMPPGTYKDKVVCPNFTFKEDSCPICKKSKSVYDQLGKDAAQPYWPKKRAYINVFDMKAGDGAVKVLEVGPTILNPILNFMAEENSDDLLDPNIGFNIMIRRYKEANFTKYETMIKPGVYDLEKHGYDLNALYDGLKDLSKMVKIPEPDDFYDILDAINSVTFEQTPQQEPEQSKSLPQGPAKVDPGAKSSAFPDDDLPSPSKQDQPQSQPQSQSQPQAEQKAEQKEIHVPDEVDDLPNSTTEKVASSAVPNTTDDLSMDGFDIESDFDTDNIPL